MAVTKQQIYGVLAVASGPVSRRQMEDEIGAPFRDFQKQVDRCLRAQPPTIEDVGDHHYVLTEAGREDMLKTGEFKDIEDEIEKEPAFKEERQVVEDEQTEVKKEPGLAGEGPTQESLATTLYQQFLKLGKVTGVIPLTLIKQTADYIWDGGDYADMKWVAQAMKDMGIRDDLRGRWWNSWRVKMHKAIPSDLPAEFFSESKKGGEKEEGGGKRDYILDENDMPVHVGERLGDLDYKDALDLSKIRATRRKDTAQPASAGSLADEVGKIFKAFKDMMGEKAEGKSYIVKPGEEGYQVEEVDTSKPVLIPQTGGVKPGPSYYIDSDGSVKELQPGQPVVIIKEAPKQTNPTSQFLIDKSTGEVKEVAPGQPLVIIRESAPVSQATPIQVKDKDGNPMVLDLSTFIKLEEHRDRQRRDEESHETKMEIAKGFKDLLNKAGKALSHMAEEEE